MKRVLVTAGARPNFMKAAPLLRAFASSGRSDLDIRLVHTGQHYDAALSRLLFDDLRMRAPDHTLPAGPGSHAEVTARILMGFEALCVSLRPDAVVVIGDVNATLACALAASKLGVPVAHVEAGLRSHDHSMPEEINRIVTDSLSTWLFATEPSAMENLAREGHLARGRAFLVGNTIVDSLVVALDHLRQGRAATAAPASPYAIATVHRPSNVDSAEVLEGILDGLGDVAREWPVILPLHPRTRARIDGFGLADRLDQPGILASGPLGYLAFLDLVRGAALVATDSGGVQEETTVLGVPCFTLRANTERPITIEVGTNQLVPPTRSGIADAFSRLLAGEGKPGRVPDLWDGHAAERIVARLSEVL